MCFTLLADLTVAVVFGVGGISVATGSTFQWPILVAAIFAAILFFAVGAAVSHHVVKKRRQKNAQVTNNRAVNYAVVLL